MKSIFAYLVIIVSILSYSVFSVYASSNCSISSEGKITDMLRECATGTAGIEVSNSASNIAGIRNEVVNFSTGALQYAALFAVAAFVGAGFMYVTAYDNDEKLKKAKTIAIYATIGLLLALMAFSLVNAIMFFIYGMGSK